MLECNLERGDLIGNIAMLYPISLILIQMKHLVPILFNTWNVKN